MKKNIEIENSPMNIVRSREYYHLLFKFTKLHHHISFSDGKFKNLLNYILPEDKNKVSVEDIFNNIKRFPSEKKFNILNNYLNLNNDSDVVKAELLVNIFFSGKEKIFKRALEVLATKEILENMVDVFNSYFTRNSYNYNNITGNIKLLFNFIPDDLRNNFNKVIVECIFSEKQKNINPIFSPDIDIKNEDIYKYLKKIIDKKDDGYNKKYLNIITENNNFYNFLNEKNFFNNNEISEKDKINIFFYFLSKHNKPLEFIEKNNEYISNIFINKDIATFSIMYQYLISYKIEQNNSIKGLKKHIDSLFGVMNKMENEVYNFYVSNLKKYDSIIINPPFRTIEPEIKNYYNESFIKSLNNHLKEESHINIEDYKKNDKNNILEYYYKLKEKESIEEALKNSNNQLMLSNHRKRI